MDVLETWFQAIKAGSLKEVVAVFKIDPDIINTFTTISDGRNRYQTNAIIEASFQGNRDIVKWLIDNNADVNSMSDGGWRPIHYAAQHGHVTTVNLLVLGGAEVNVRTDAGETPVLLALQSYMRDTVKKLMYHGASLLGIDRAYLHMLIQKEVLDPACLDDENKAYLAAVAETGGHHGKPGGPVSVGSVATLNGYELVGRRPEPTRDLPQEELRPVRVARARLTTSYDGDLRRRRLDLLKKRGRAAVAAEGPPGSAAALVRDLAMAEGGEERLRLAQEALAVLEAAPLAQLSQPPPKAGDSLVTLLELAVCDSDCGEALTEAAARLTIALLQQGGRRPDSVVVDFWVRIFDKMSNLQIEQYSRRVLALVAAMLEAAPPSVLSGLRAHQDHFLKAWEYFFENLGFPLCLDGSLAVLRIAHRHIPEAINARFQNVIDIVIGWCIHPDSDIGALESLRARCADLRACWLSDAGGLRKTVLDLQKDVIGHLQALSRLHRPADKDRGTADDLRTKIRYFLFALSCAAAGLSGHQDPWKVPSTERVDDLDETGREHAGLAAAAAERLVEGLGACGRLLEADGGLLTQALTVIAHLLVSCAPPEGPRAHASVLRYLLAGDGPCASPTAPRPLLEAGLDLALRCLAHAFPAAPMDSATVVGLLGPGGWIHGCLLSQGHRPLAARVLKVARATLKAGKGVATTILYQIVLSDLELAVNALLRASGCQRQLRLVQINAFKAANYEPDQAQMAVRYNLRLGLLVHGLAKDGPTALEPPLPILLAKYLSFCEPALARMFPATAILLLEAVNRACDSFDLMRYNCQMVAVEDPAVRRAAFSCLQRALDASPAPLDSPSAETVLEAVCGLSLAVALDTDTLVKCLEMALSLARTPGLSSTTRGTLRAVGARLASHAEGRVRLSALEALHLAGPGPETQEALSPQEDRLRALAKRGRSPRSPLDLSKAVFTWVLTATEDGISGGPEARRIIDLVLPGDRSRPTMLHEVVVNACWDCVRQKLRFDAGGDSRATLVTIEQTLRCVLTGGASVRAVGDRGLRRLLAQWPGKAPEDQAVSVNLLLLLIGGLEKALYNGYAGVCEGMPAAGASAQAFLGTNRPVLEDWMAKTRLMVVAMAQYAGQWAEAAWHGLRLLADRDLAAMDGPAPPPEVEDCLVFTSVALGRLGHWEALLGLGVAAQRLYGPQMAWVLCLADKARGRLEAAATGLHNHVLRYYGDERQPDAEVGSGTRLLKRRPANVGHSSFIVCMEELADCKRLLGELEALREWQARIEAWRGEVPEASKCAVNWERLERLARLSRWDLDKGDREDGPEVTATTTTTTGVSWKYRPAIDALEDLMHSKGASEAGTYRSVARLASVHGILDQETTPDLVLASERARLLSGASGTGLAVLEGIHPLLPVQVHNYQGHLRGRGAPGDVEADLAMARWHRRHLNLATSGRLVGLCQLAAPTDEVARLRLGREAAKLQWALGQRRDALEALSLQAREGLLLEAGDARLHRARGALNGKTLRTLFKWLSAGPDEDLLAGDVLAGRLRALLRLAEAPWVRGLPLAGPDRPQAPQAPLCPADVCAQLLLLAGRACSDGGDSRGFQTLAQWCLGRSRALEEAGLAPGEAEAALGSRGTLLAAGVTPARMAADRDWLGPCYEDPAFPDSLGVALPEEDLPAWRALIARHFSLHLAAADAFFSFLRESSAAGSAGETTTTTLRLLALLGRRSRPLREAIASKIRASRPQAWTSVLPQLFARTRHPDPVVRAAVTDLLTRLARLGDTQRRLIVFPALVAAPADDEIRKVLADCDPVLVRDVDLFVRELRRLTVLWDELWVSALAQAHEELAKKAGQMQAEMDRAPLDQEQDADQQRVQQVVLRLKYEALVQPALFVLERTRTATSRPPETPRELWFRSTFQEEIDSTIEAVRRPADIADFRKTWKKVRELSELIVTEAAEMGGGRPSVGRRARHSHLLQGLRLEEVSPGLARMTGSRVPLPGVPGVSVAAVGGLVAVLATKTRPKRLEMTGSDGKKRDYLYKGLEDLRLDERVMQVLDLANGALFPDSLAVTTYQVTPLGPRAGLIQMVAGATSLFSLYRRHLQRTTPGPSGTAPRPTEVYWQRLRPRLDPALPRDRWPLPALLEVLADLQRETPRDLLARELWACSPGPRQWLAASQRFARSAAAMSILGHVLGLGDRHLDNLLVHLTTGQVVHIDYNVCFDKGAQLKVPETVPFRLTGIVTGVLGPSGVEGVFRLACERALEGVRGARDSLLTLMDAFVLDPVHDWVPGAEAGHYGSLEGGTVAGAGAGAARKRVEAAVALCGLRAVLAALGDRQLVQVRAGLTGALEQALGQSEAAHGAWRALQDARDRQAATSALLAQLANEDRCRDLGDRVAALRDAGAALLVLRDDMGLLKRRAASEAASWKALLETPLPDHADKYVALLTEVPEGAATPDRCSHTALLLEGLLEEESFSEASVEVAIRDYRRQWQPETDSKEENEEDAERDRRRRWARLFSEQTALAEKAGLCLPPAGTEQEELQLLEGIWQLAVLYEGAGVSVLKAVLLEQYLEMALSAVTTDQQVAGLAVARGLVDSGEPLRRYCQLGTAHDNLFKILTGAMAAFGADLGAHGAAAAVLAQMAALQRVCAAAGALEATLVSAIVPEALRTSCVSPSVLKDIQGLLHEGDGVMLHFNTALTSPAYDGAHYEAGSHARTAASLRDRVRAMSASEGDSVTERLLRAVSAVEEAAGEMASPPGSVPASWGCLDLTAQCAQAVSPVAAKSGLLLRDAVLVAGLRLAHDTLGQCAAWGDLDQDPGTLLRPLEAFLALVQRHVLAGLGSLSLARLVCLLIELSGWGLDGMAPDGQGPLLSAQYVCGAVAAARECPLYSQLQARCQGYRAIVTATGPRLQARNATFHRAMAAVARARLLESLWLRDDLGDGQDQDEEVRPVATEVRMALETAPAPLMRRERLRSRLKTEEAARFDEEILGLLKRAVAVLGAAKEAAGAVGPEEAPLVALRTDYPDLWWRDMAADLGGALASQEAEVAALSICLEARLREEEAGLVAVRAAVAGHYQPLVARLKGPLRALYALTRRLRAAREPGLEESGLADVCRLMGFCEGLTAAMETLARIDLGPEDGMGLSARLAAIKGLLGRTVPGLFLMLARLSPLRTEDHSEAATSPEENMLLEEMAVCGGGREEEGVAHPLPGEEEDGEEGSQGRRGGAHRAVEAWRLVEARLAPGEEVPAAVDRLLRAAAAPENLARMYEGWTAWV